MRRDERVKIGVVRQINGGCVDKCVWSDNLLFPSSSGSPFWLRSKGISSCSAFVKSFLMGEKERPGDEKRNK